MRFACRRGGSVAAFSKVPGIRLPSVPSTIQVNEAIMSEMNYELGFLYVPCLCFPVTFNFLFNTNCPLMASFID